MTTHTAGEPYGSPGPPESYGSFGPPDPFAGQYAYGDPPTMALRPIPAQGSFGPVDPSYAQPVEHPQPTEQFPAQRKAEPEPQPAAAETTSDGRNGLIMALGTMGSRALGFVRSAMIVAALTTGPLGDSFNVANSLPNIVYTMLIGGVLASVFVPELVHAAQTHKDGGVAYTDRLLTICTVALVILTVGAWLFAPQIVDLYSDYSGAQRDLTIAFARCCLPQIFFYGLFTLLGQVLTSRNKFGAMMWTPILNNVVAIAVFGLYMAIASGARTVGHMTTGQVLLLGWGSTLGVVVQTVGLLPSLRAVRFRWHPRFDWRGSGLTKPLRAATWALLLVVATQLAYAVISRLSTSAGTQAAHAGLKAGLGNIAYSNAYLLFVVPQGVITISLVTAVLPRMSRAASKGKLQEIGADLAQVLKSSAGMIMAATLLFIALAPQIAAIAFEHGVVGADSAWVIAQLLMVFAIGLPAFCAQYALARGFYAMGDARTPFWLTVVSSGTNAGLSCLAYWTLSPRWIVIGMAGAQTVACVVNVVITGRALSRRLRTVPVPTAAPDQTMMLRSPFIAPPRSGLDGRRVFGLHLGLLLAGLPGAVIGHWLADQLSAALGGGLIGNMLGLGVGSVAVLASLFLLARVFGAGAAVAPLARKLRIPYPEPAAVGGKHRR
ncbi:putative peptidoglycan lipid II flippase [Kitasatospora sp. MAP12-15]|uniref:murein biosynthesis integral membrane protein MurJ n=2 Tax=unclassified Kitasatospora TaxID=2633591 RepID=UPI00247359F9|nr:murein biosynthesis integral membrane protein MurJ [Kitasatospora sp. MAP12-44]MDH6112420.1 putative peptidoglycan lipid II flippase [Kitasatospora sp. MAP12-44]